MGFLHVDTRWKLYVDKGQNFYVDTRWKQHVDKGQKLYVSTRRKRSRKMCGILVILLGVIQCVVSWTGWKCTSTTTGTVLELCRNPREYNTGTATFMDVLYREPGKYHMIYTYEVDGKTYNRASETAYTKGYISRRIGTPVTVYFNPKQPEESALSELSPDMRGGIKIIVFGSIVFIFSILLVFRLGMGR